MKNIRSNTGIILFDKIVDKFFRDKREIKYLNQFYKEVPCKDKINKARENILIYTVIGYLFYNPIEVLLNHPLIDRGVNVDY